MRIELFLRTYYLTLNKIKANIQSQSIEFF